MLSELDNLESILESAWSPVALAWPQTGFVASNPLKGLEEKPFALALESAAELFSSIDLAESMQHVNIQTVKWCQYFFDEGQLAAPLPHKDKGLFQSWRQYVPLDPKLKKYKFILERVPKTAKEAIDWCLQNLDIPDECFDRFLQRLLTLLPGWSAYINYLEENQKIACKWDYLALRLSLAYLFQVKVDEVLNQESLQKQQSILSSQLFDIEKNEEQFLQTLLSQLRSNSQMDRACKQEADAQLIFCIDVRSEGIRRSLENVGSYETFGAAGFFNLPIAVSDGLKRSSSCPVILNPAHEVEETLLVHPSSWFGKWKNKVQSVAQGVKSGYVAPFIWAELAGPFFALKMFTRLLSAQKWFIRLKSACSRKKVRRVLTPLHDIAPDQQSQYAEAFLRSIGLTENFSKFVVLCGHAAEVKNNAQKDSFNCGACAGRHGLTNAHLMSHLLNKKAVRHALFQQGIEIPLETEFLAALHITTTDEIQVYLEEGQDISESALARLTEDLSKAQLQACSERVHCRWSAKQKSKDWSDTRPEWGLAQNAAFFIGPRSLTQGIDLGRRTFLHSYDWTKDQTSKILQAILAGPLEVTFWINSQYLFSTMDNRLFGAGSKITQNITGCHGVMQGNGSDLMHGLSLQSVFASDSTPYHQVQRLTALIYAPKKALLQAICEVKTLKQRVKNSWLCCICWDPEDHQFYKLSSELDWESLG